MAFFALSFAGKPRVRVYGDSAASAPAYQAKSLVIFIRLSIFNLLFRRLAAYSANDDQS